jgi:hypothetical protein
LSHVPSFVLVGGGIALVILIVAILAATSRRFREYVEDLFFNFGWRFDVTFGVVVTAVLFGILASGGFDCVLLEFLKSDGTAIYGALLSSFTALLGFAVAILAIVCTVIPTLRLERHLTSTQYDDFLNAFTLSIRTLGLCTVASLLALFLNRSTHIREALFFVIAVVVAIAVPSVVRSAAALEQVVKVVANKPVRARRTHRPKNPSVVP